MLKPVYTKKFQKDLKRVKKRNKDTVKLKAVITILLRQEKLPARYKNHRLTGNLVGKLELHIEPDWLLIYKSDSNSVTFISTGSHSDLF